MHTATRGSSAYKLDFDKRTQKKTVKKKAARRSRNTVKPILGLICFFGIMALISFRFVQIYGLHNEVEKSTAILENLKMENEQMSIAINEMAGSSKIAEYATENLGLRKIESRQIVYLNPSQKNVMSKVASSEEKSSVKGIFGVFSGVLEYLR